MEKLVDKEFHCLEGLLLSFVKDEPFSIHQQFIINGTPLLRDIEPLWQGIFLLLLGTCHEHAHYVSISQQLGQKLLCLKFYPDISKSKKTWLIIKRKWYSKVDSESVIKLGLTNFAITFLWIDTSLEQTGGYEKVSLQQHHQHTRRCHCLIQDSRASLLQILLQICCKKRTLQKIRANPA